MTHPVCPYCGHPSQLVTGREVYPRRKDLARNMYYLCEPCDAYVGCHPHTVSPLGRLANAQLRGAKQWAHAVFDPIWQSKRMTRKDAYLWLAGQLGISINECHIGHFDIDQCRAVVEICGGKV